MTIPASPAAEPAMPHPFEPPGRSPADPPAEAPGGQPAGAPAVAEPPGHPDDRDMLARATRAQRIGAVVALLVVTWLALQLFASVLLPFVAAAGIAYVLDPPTTRLERLGVPRGAAALLMLLALIAAALLFALLLYPLILAQVGILFSRVPEYVLLLQGWANQEIAHLQQSFGSQVVNDKLRDLVSSQAGAMLSFLASALSRLIGGGFALFNVLTLMVVTPVVAFYLLRDWPRLVGMIDSWLPRRYAAVIRAQVREVDRILSAWVRGPGAVLRAAGGLLHRRAVLGGAGSGADRRAGGGGAVVHPLCRLDHRRRDRDRPGTGAVP